MKKYNISVYQADGSYENWLNVGAYRFVSSTDPELTALPDSGRLLYIVPQNVAVVVVTEDTSVES